MKTGLAFFIGLLLFSGGGMQGRIGSVVAAIIDPTALVETGGNTQQPGQNNGTNRGLTPGEQKLPGLNGNPGVPPVKLDPGTNNSCPQGYIYSPVTKKCESLAGI